MVSVPPQHDERQEQEVTQTIPQHEQKSPLDKTTKPGTSSCKTSQVVGEEVCISEKLQERLGEYPSSAVLGDKKNEPIKKNKKTTVSVTTKDGGSDVGHIKKKEPIKKKIVKKTTKKTKQIPLNPAKTAPPPTTAPVAGLPQLWNGVQLEITDSEQQMFAEAEGLGHKGPPENKRK